MKGDEKKADSDVVKADQAAASAEKSALEAKHAEKKNAKLFEFEQKK